MNIQSAYYRIKERLLSVFYKKYYMLFPGKLQRKKKNSPRIIVSVTSFPPRLEKLYISLNSIMSQSMQPDKLVLYLGDDVDRGDLPKTLIELMKRGLDIRFVDDNLCSHKKYYYAIQEYPEDLIITVDDDLLYPKDMIRKLYESYRKYPNCVSAMRTHEIAYNDDGIPVSYSIWKKNSERYDCPSSDLFFTSGAGTLFPPNCFDERVLDKKTLMDKCFTADDVWLNCMCRLKSTKIVNVVLSKTERKLMRVLGTQEIALKNVNLYAAGNDKCISNIINEFGVGAL